MERLQKVIANSGYSSRRKAEELIVAGKVYVNGKKITELGTKVNGDDVITINGEAINNSEDKVYYLLNKPRGVISSVSDDKDRKTVMDLLRAVHTRVYPVGRLDYDTEGLLLLTNDGEITNILTKPNSEVKKTYVVHIESGITKEEIKKLTSGVDIGGYKTKPCSIEEVEIGDKLSKLRITITEGKNRQIRKMFEAMDKNVIFLRRVQIGEIRLGGLSRGEYAPLNSKEIRYLNNLKK